MLSWDAQFPKLDSMDVDSLEVPFLEDEIHKVLMGTDRNKVLGSNRFTFKFGQSFWPEFKSEMISLFDWFFEMLEFDHHFSSSFIFLILKVNSPSGLNDFRMIFHLSWIHKLVTRVMPARLKGVIRKSVRDT